MALEGDPRPMEIDAPAQPVGIERAGNSLYRAGRITSIVYGLNLSDLQGGGMPSWMLGTTVRRTGWCDASGRL
jgi:hypothetical protein